MIDIIGEDITKLSDVDLRILIGLLCEADLRSIGLQTAGVTWGGHHNAKDGGIDVRVNLDSPIHTDNFIPRSKTGFQVRKPNMQRSSIINEMKPNGELRQIIKDLINTNGAYIIVSSQGSTADSALANRKNAMLEALDGYPNATNLKIDFYDRERVASWVRSHPSLILWVREKIGRPVQGWKTYGHFSNPSIGIEEEYIIDGHIRLYSRTNSHSTGFSALDGINELRTILHRTGSSIRLVGLSGVGKTRLVQALFDERIGENPLNQSQVFYSDINDNPNPHPQNFVEQIIAQQTPAIIVIDNCTSELHKRLTFVCSTSNSLVSLITIEYDVKEDQPEETEVFHLEPASTDLIEKIVDYRFNHVSKVDSQTIAEFSGGNARIAIALANTIKRDEHLANLRDEDLFVRLFHQRNLPSSSLLDIAGVCSLVYSFNSQTDDDADTELHLLGALIKVDVNDIYKGVRELQRRDLIQQRGVWRAVLPHAIANKLAKRALENIPLNYICNVFEKGGSIRLLKSFSRRLSYLHDCDEAKEISRKWLLEDGLLGRVTDLDEFNLSLLENIAPINPELTLAFIKRTIDQEKTKNLFSISDYNYFKFTEILRSLAYDKNLFNQSATLLCHLAISDNSGHTKILLKSLFYIQLSGTHATPEQRLRIIVELVGSNQEKRVALGISLLSAALDVKVDPYPEFGFGARSRNYGFLPNSEEEIQQWFKLFIEYTVTLVIPGLPIATRAKTLLAEKFRDLWNKAGMYNSLELAARKIISKTTWKEGWAAVKVTQKIHSQDLSPEILSRLNELDLLLKPISLIERVKLHILSPHTDVFFEESESIDTVVNDRFLPTNETARSLGYEVCSNNEILKELLPDILSNDGARLFSFGQGLADGCRDYTEMWWNFCEELSLIDETNRNYSVLRGFLSTIPTGNSEKLLDEAVTNKILAIIYPYLQTSVAISSKGVERLKQSIELGITPIHEYINLAGESARETLSDSDLCELLKLICLRPNGVEVSIEIMQIRLRNQEKRGGVGDILISYGQELLLNYQIPQAENYTADALNYKLASIIRVCLVDELSKENAHLLCNKFAVAFTNHDVYSRDYDYVLEALATVQPIAFLDNFVGENPRRINYRFKAMYLKDTRSFLSYIDDNLIIDWCKANPEIRYLTISSVIVPYQKIENSHLLKWNSLALKIIEIAPNPIKVLNQFKLAFRFISEVDSRATLMQKSLVLISYLKKHEDPSIAEWAHKEEHMVKQDIHFQRELELKLANDLNEHFE
ncbi:hypothetical protein [Bacillus cereus]|uniref:Uncharacterized protein n=1 Tax=Bacillus cereus TaxID=1396 RepID=A0A2A7HUP4_BACCE|nr:hypothetical protein [Bacillus cereus]PEC20553.1 hypothetical protein COM96_18755 [Bacillus cereus]